ncbi:hypothetical protein BCR35DRAFT_300439 [Leucosporidium creatinivorum]|uniref:Uncharacterized protein n=1 Tax=Leucosporidium creatinivorum TaxID=106004 RepID=A0A1Y2G2X8_9BASI|nr:hypothetical protein BCR35DRAFT_300439 [Leucosporidium creatinivorum]
MSADILVSVPSSLALVILDTLLASLTHSSPLKRRLALIAFFASIFLSIHVTFSLRHALAHPLSLASVKSSTTTTDYEAQDAAALAYIPASPTAAQDRAYQDLLSLIVSRKSAYPGHVFQEKALRTASTKVVGVTAVLLHWKRKKGLDLVLRHITRYPYIREVIIWNNRPGIDLKASDFPILMSPPGTTLPPAHLRIFNSPSNVHDAGKHFGCSMASNEHCYFNDDDWLNIYMDSLYTKYLECCSGSGGHGGRIVSNTMPIIHLEHRRWRFENPDLDLHTGFTWLGTGSFSPRSFSTRFLQQQSAAPVGLTRDQSMWPNNLVPIDVEGGEVGWSRGANVDQWAVVYANILTAIRSLHDILLLSPPYLCPSPFSLSPPPPESHTRAPCANDACLFSTSLSPFPPPDALSFQNPPSSSWGALAGWIPSLVGRRSKTAAEEQVEARFDPWAIEHVHEHEKRWNEVAGEDKSAEGAGRALAAGATGASSAPQWSWPSDEWWTNNGSWHLAVDGKGAETCWESWRAPENNDHFGLTLIVPRLVRVITLIGSADLGNVVASEHSQLAGEESWQLYTVREDGSGGWEPRRFLTAAPYLTPAGPGLVAVTLQLEPLFRRQVNAQTGIEETGVEVPIRKIKFVSKGRKRAKVQVCGWNLDGWKV